MTTKDQILDLSRQNDIAPLSPWFDGMLDQAITDGYYPDEVKLNEINDRIIATTREYREQTGVSTVVLGMSGGVDSALTAAIFKKAGYRVVGVTMPINQNPDETDRGVEACSALGIEHKHIDLTRLYNVTLGAMAGTFIDPPVGHPHIGSGPGLDPVLNEILDHADPATKAVLIRRGNVRARLRMTTLYNLASLEGGMVASTDNLSELGAGFWTLHGDVGDFSPIQSLLKSWEVPYLARLNGVPESTVRAKPTDGLGISAGDEAQLGCSYLEWDIMTYALAVGDAEIDFEEEDPRRKIVFDAVTRRMGATWYKRMNPLNVPHPFEDRYGLVESIDRERFVPACFGGNK